MAAIFAALTVQEREEREERERRERRERAKREKRESEKREERYTVGVMHIRSTVYEQLFHTHRERWIEREREREREHTQR